MQNRTDDSCQLQSTKKTNHLGSTWHPFSAIQSQVSTKQLEEKDAFLLKYFVASKKQCKTGLTTAVNCNQQREGGIIGFNPAPISYHLPYNLTLLIKNI
jgi:hypothetical protein